jgi:hypothetical protein
MGAHVLAVRIKDAEGARCRPEQDEIAAEIPQGPNVARGEFVRPGNLEPPGGISRMGKLGASSIPNPYCGGHGFPLIDFRVDNTSDVYHCQA